MKRERTIQTIITACGLVIGGAILATYGFSLLHSLEFGPAGYLCPAYVCTLDELFQAGYGWLVYISYTGILLFGAGVAFLVVTLVLEAT